MCDGQFRLVQNYLREQRDNIVTINLVGEVAVFAQVDSVVGCVPLSYPFSLCSTSTTI